MKARLNTSARTSLSLAASLLVLTAQGALAATPAGTSISNTASAVYIDATLTARSATSNTVVTLVQQVGSVGMDSGGAKNAAPGAQVVHTHTVTNTGNGADTFALTSSNSGSFAMTNVVFYADANGDGIADDANPITNTGPLAPGASFRFVAVGTLPANAVAGTDNAMVVTATSTFNAGVSASSTGTTTVTAAALMDITANSAGSGAPGAGAGVEAAAVVTNTTIAGGTTRFTLYLNNAGGSADTFSLQSSIDAGFAGQTLPAGWTVVFQDAGGNVINSASVNGGASRLVYADVTVATGATVGVTDLYFRAMSTATGVGDRIHQAVSVAEAGTQLTLAKTQALDANCDGVADTAFSADNITAGAVPGACIRYQITATNSGASLITGVFIRDMVPANTGYHAVGSPAGATLGTILAPLANALGLVETNVGILTPGQSSTMSFGVRINQ